jgi:hypothetical protein
MDMQTRQSDHVYFLCPTNTDNSENVLKYQILGKGVVSRVVIHASKTSYSCLSRVAPNYTSRFREVFLVKRFQSKLSSSKWSRGKRKLKNDIFLLVIFCYKQGS